MQALLNIALLNTSVSAPDRRKSPIHLDPKHCSIQCKIECLWGDLVKFTKSMKKKKVDNPV